MPNIIIFPDLLIKIYHNHGWIVAYEFSKYLTKLGFANFVLISFAFLDSLKVDKESPKYIKSFNLSVWVGGLWETQGGLFKDKINWRQETSEMAQWEEIISKVVSMDTLVVSLRFHVHTIVVGKFHECFMNITWKRQYVYIFDTCVVISVKIHEKSTLDYVYSVFSRTKDA